MSETMKIMVGHKYRNKCMTCGKTKDVRNVFAVNGLALDKPEPTCSSCRRKELCNVPTEDVEQPAAPPEGEGVR